MSRLTLKKTSALRLMLLAATVLAIGSSAAAQYTMENLVTTNKTTAPHHDPNLVNAWGISFLPTSPFWVSDNGTGKTSIYDPSGDLQLTVSIPPASGTGLGTPTGQVANPNNTIFMISKGTAKASALFIFATLDGTISGWNPTVDMPSAVIAVNKSAAGNIYTGLAIATIKTSTGTETFLYAADAGHNKVDVFNSSFKLVDSFSDPNTPPGLAVYGIQNVRGRILLTLAAFGSKAGAVDTYNPLTKVLKRLITNAAGGPLNDPWGLAMAPSTFGTFSNDLLVGNVGNGRINAFNPTTGAFIGTLKNTAGRVITLPGLWALEFGGGNANNGPKNNLFFASGPDGYRLGIFGVIKP
jgi:uncharacterized protein (TIGR03118 family)